MGISDETTKDERSERDGILYREERNAGLRRAALLARQCPVPASTPTVIKETIAEAIEWEVQE